MRKALTLMLAVSVILVIAGILPSYAVISISDESGSQNPGINRTGQINTKEPSWEYLRLMSDEEKANAIIQIELGRYDNLAVKSTVTRVENLWNNGRYKSALAEFENLARLYGSSSFAIGVSWRVPLPTDETALWGADVRIGNRDSIYINCFDIHRTSGHLFAILAYLEGGNGYWSVNLSTNGGASWNETYVWYAGSGQQAASVSASVLGNYCYVAYRPSDYPYEARLRRFYADNGSVYPAYTTVYSTAAPDTIREVVVTSNQDYFNNRIYYLGIGKNGDLRYFWGDTTSTSWSEIATGITNAQRGLDATCNEGYTSKYLLASYIDNTDTLHIDYHTGPGSWNNSKKLYIGTSPVSTSISAYHDTIICFHEYLGSMIYCRYQISYNNGDNWYYGAVDDTTTNLSAFADVTARDGGGFGVAYRYYSPTREIRFVRRGYPQSPGWSTPISVSDNEPYPSGPSIEYLGGGTFGTVYLSWALPSRGAYFDRSGSACDYFLGDINGDGVRIGGDVTYGVRYFKGIGAPPPDSCYMDSTHTYLYVAGDVNGNCEFRGSDITRLVSFFKGTAVISNCHFFPTAPLIKNDNELPIEVIEQ